MRPIDADPVLRELRGLEAVAAAWLKRCDGRSRLLCGDFLDIVRALVVMVDEQPTIDPDELSATRESDLRRLSYFRGILRNRLQDRGAYYDHDLAMALLVEARRLAYVSLEDLETAVMTARNWSHFRAIIDVLASGEPEEVG